MTETAPVPQRDGRARIHQSKLIYGLNAYFMGRTIGLSFSEGMQRVIHITDSGLEMVTYDRQLRPLYTPDLMAELVELAIARRGDVWVRNTAVASVEQIVPHHFFLLSYMRDKEETFAKLQRMLKRFRMEKLRAQQDAS